MKEADFYGGEKKEYTPQAIRERLLDNQRYVGYVPFQNPKYAPLLTLEIEYRRMMRMDTGAVRTCH